MVVMNADGSVSEDKMHIRDRIKKLRNNMSKEECIQKSKLICRRFCELDEYKSADNICIYISKGNEVNTKIIVDQVWKDGKKLYVPKVYGKLMHFIQITGYDELVKGNFGILEPKSDEYDDDGMNGLMVMPGVAFDEDRNRIGFGGGYYDRYLADHSKLMTVALAYECQIVSHIDHELTDIKPHMILTESKII